ncbi:glycosyltransferase [Alkalibacterium thalassium]|uniref:Glycosyltransferase involved in cell wall bisynthesis n=1 Tax=Alkalibacterium thalassium TaxID=426701 RepID=A0A1G9BM02_9LACT|nr:glycosyltransferase [Alkalibacterium thalassium]SDK40423.1 Glycosyltransferase involved in cell wall bisynthesis [Alkalibacterium thalassium]
MIGLFSFDGPMYKDKNGVYCNTTITSEMFTRYFKVVDKLIVVIRTYHLDKTFKEASLKKVELDGLEFIEIPNLNSINGFLIDRTKYKKVIYDQVKKSDLIFARMPSSISDITIQIARRLGKPYMVEVGGCAWDSFWNHGLLGKIIAPYMYFNEVKGVRNASFASYVTEKWLQSRYPCNCSSISASNVYLMPLKLSVLEKRISKIISKDRKNPFIIGTTAAVNVQYKGQEYIIRAISELNKRGYNFEYELVGGGDNSYLKGLVKKYGVEDKVRFKGLLLHDNVFPWLDSIDIYAQPSKQEGLPRALIEAMSRGCPAVGSTTAGIPELLDKDVIFQNGDMVGICNILMKLVSNDLSAYATRNFNKAKEFEIENLEEKRNKLFSEYKDYVKNNSIKI